MSKSEWVETERRFEALVPICPVGPRTRQYYLAVLDRVTKHREVGGKSEWRTGMEYSRYISAQEAQDLGIDLALDVAGVAVENLHLQLARAEARKKLAEKHAKRQRAAKRRPASKSS